MTETMETTPENSENHKSEMTTMWVPRHMLEVEIESLKQIDREANYAVVRRLIDFYVKNGGETSANYKP